VFIVITSFIFLFFSPFVFACVLPSAVVNFTQQQYGAKGVQHIQDWCALINSNKNQPELAKLRIVTDFFNQIPYKTDQEVWGIANYWATPIEFLGKYAGDCEDYVIAKYLTLEAMGVSSDKMRMVYVVSSELSETHMVLAYYTTKDSEPLILDSLTPWIKFASERPDLRPVYMFNDQGLWMNQKDNHAKQVASGSRFIEWQNVLTRMYQQGLTEDDLAS
jgi:predicted transglutaminase-like cysteine proteinase